ncbi:WxL domain-containing protein [Enterococcus caccae]|uniref:WxL domain-containing protein n=1 Tax=Enterococcus caccae ATCC BAA-1240 TaxID=1158612 RepID=R3TUE3_9ENTE|nr:WxL domain-containing protein [Enterococcus caccae]EOL45214.1 hypothetical protein UC7_02020 [Enterococcus caccae ATCC BAA-1240]EOT58621.1 hypothetical protein I580_02792 [Enterococcus caccae ATCC BAA-1240]OJG27051.1 hypothetical protein RU98_GL002831 [Enterococcus caccae]
MKNKTLLSIAALFSIVSLTGLTAFAAEAPATAQGTVSKNHITFQANNNPTKPVNPVDPEVPLDPTLPIDSEDPENPGTGNEGALTIDYISNIQFGEKDIESGDTVYNASNESPFFQVTDKRGTGAGWALSAQTQGFKTTAGKQLKGAELSFKNGEIKTRSGNVSAKPLTKDVVFNNNDAKVIMSAKKDAGRGTWLDVFTGEEGNNEKIQLKVLEGSADANVEYTAEINWTLSNAPK